MSQANFIALCASLFLAHPGRVTSWYRSPKANYLLGGSINSWHLFGLAVDYVLDDSAATAVFRADSARLGLVCLDEGDHLHLQPKVSKA